MASTRATAATRGRMESRLLFAALARRRGMVMLAIVAVAIGAAVTSSLLLVSRDVGHKLARELRALGPNLLLLPADAGSSGVERVPPAAGWAARPRVETARSRYLDESRARDWLADARLDGVPLLYAVGDLGGRTVQVVGADLAAARRLHPSWRIPADSRAWIGSRLARRFGITPGARLELAYAPTGRRLALTAGAFLETGGPDDEAVWIPLADLQGLTGLAGRLSLIQARIEGGADRVPEARRARAERAGMRVVVLHALSAAEGDLLARTRRLMGLVAAAALIASTLCAFGTLTDLALERRREVALLKALGATRRDLARLFGGESVVVGLLGGAGGWLVGLGFAQMVGHQVFHSAIRVQWTLLPWVLALSLAVAAAAAIGPIRFALGVDPAPVLKGE